MKEVKCEFCKKKINKTNKCLNCETFYCPYENCKELDFTLHQNICPNPNIKLKYSPTIYQELDLIFNKVQVFLNQSDDDLRDDEFYSERNELFEEVIKSLFYLNSKNISNNDIIFQNNVKSKLILLIDKISSNATGRLNIKDYSFLIHEKMSLKTSKDSTYDYFSSFPEFKNSETFKLMEAEKDQQVKIIKPNFIIEKASKFSLFSKNYVIHDDYDRLNIARKLSKSNCKMNFEKIGMTFMTSHDDENILYCMNENENENYLMFLDSKLNNTKISTLDNDISDILLNSKNDEYFISTDDKIEVYSIKERKKIRDYMIKNNQSMTNIDSVLISYGDNGLRCQRDRKQTFDYHKYPIFEEGGRNVFIDRIYGENEDNSILLNDCKISFSKFDIEKGIETGIFIGHSNYVTNFISTPNFPNMILTCSLDGYGKLWDNRTTECVLSFDFNCESISTSCLVNGNGIPFAFFGGQNEGIVGFDLRKHNCLYELSTGNTTPDFLHWHQPTNNLIIFGDYKYKLHENEWPNDCLHPKDHFDGIFDANGNVMIKYDFN
eukprot:gene2224-2398_t